MRSKYSNIAILIAAILSFLPALAAGYVVDSYARARMTTAVQRAADDIGADIEANADDAIASLRRVLEDSPSLCTPTFLLNVRKAIQTSLHLKDVVVENATATQYCDGFGGTVDYMAHVGAPAPMLSTIIAVIMEFVVGILILVGFYTRPLAVLLALYTVATAIIAHHFWNMTGAEQMANMINFYKNVSIAGGLLALAVSGPGRLSIDRK